MTSPINNKKLKLKTPLLRPLRDKGATFYVFPSATEDIGLNINAKRNQVELSHFALLDIPSSNTLEQSKEQNRSKNYFNPSNIKTHLDFLEAHSTSNRKPNFIIAESLQNYVMNMETAIRNNGGYDYSEPQTISEKVFFKWLIEIGAIRFTKDANGNIVEEFEFDIDELGTSIPSGYKRVVKCIGGIKAFSTDHNESGIYSESYIHVPTTYGETQQFFKSETSNNYILGNTYKGDFIIENRSKEASNASTQGVTPLTDYGLPFTSFFDTASNGGSGYVTKPLLNNTTSYNDIHSISGRTFLKSKFDGISLVKDLDTLRSITRNENLSYDEFASQGGDFKFNTVLLYYSIYDNAKKSVIATNLYGVIFLNGVQETGVNRGGQTNFTLPTLEKIVSSASNFGTSYSFKVNIKTLDVYDDTSATIYDSSTSSHLIPQEFTSSIQNLDKAVRLLGEQYKLLEDISREKRILETKYNQLYRDLKAVEENMKGLLGEKFDKLLEREHLKLKNLDVDTITSSDAVPIIIDGKTVLTITKSGIATNHIETDTLSLNDLYQRYTPNSSKSSAINPKQLTPKEAFEVLKQIETKIVASDYPNGRSVEELLLVPSSINIKGIKNKNNPSEINYTKLIPYIIEAIKALPTSSPQGGNNGGGSSGDSGSGNNDNPQTDPKPPTSIFDFLYKEIEFVDGTWRIKPNSILLKGDKPLDYILENGIWKKKTS